MKKIKNSAEKLEDKFKDTLMKAEYKEKQVKNMNHRGRVVSVVKKLTSADRSELAGSGNMSSRGQN